MERKEKHTPGSWVIGSTIEIHKNGMGSITEILPEKEPCGWHTPICWINGRAIMESGANARLIKAAPKLLEACFLLMDAEEMQLGKRDGGTMGKISKAIDAARAALSEVI